MNKYGVKFKGSTARGRKLSGPELLCQLKERVKVTTITPNLKPFSELPWSSELPSLQLTSVLGPFESCAVVSSAGSLRNSGLGREIGERATPSAKNLPSSHYYLRVQIQKKH